MIRIALLLAACALLGACAHVEPWQRGHLARAEMAFDPDPGPLALGADLRQQGGGRIGGGGCGCN